MVVACYPKCHKQHQLSHNFEISTDASESGWGSADGVNPIGGICSTPDKANNINLELLAIKHALVN